MANGYYDMPTGFFDKPEDITSQNLSYFRASGAIISTAHDLALFSRALLSNHSLLPLKQQQELMSLVNMQTGQHFEMAEHPSEFGYGLGVYGASWDDTDQIWAFSGGSRGYVSTAWWLKCNDVLITSVINHVDKNECNGKRLDDFSNQINELLLKSGDNLCKAKLSMWNKKASMHKFPNVFVYSGAQATNVSQK